MHSLSCKQRAPEVRIGHSFTDQAFSIGHMKDVLGNKERQMTSLVSLRNLNFLLKAMRS